MPDPDPRSVFIGEAWKLYGFQFIKCCITDSNVYFMELPASRYCECHCGHQADPLRNVYNKYRIDCSLLSEATVHQYKLSVTTLGSGKRMVRMDACESLEDPYNIYCKKANISIVVAKNIKAIEKFWHQHQLANVVL